MPRKVLVSEVVLHNKPEDIWIVVNGQVYDMTDFSEEHPGGAEIIHSFGGRDASKAYNEVHAPSLIQKTLEYNCHIGALDVASINDEWQVKTAPSAQISMSESATETSLESIINLNDFEESAQQSLSEKPWAIISGGSNDNITRDANISILQRIWLRPAVLRDVGQVNTRSQLFGCDLHVPIYIAPMGGAKAGGPDGELAMAKGAAASSIIHCISTPASFPHDEILEATPRHAFFQVYVNKDRQKSKEAIHKMTKSGKIKAIFVTADLPVISKREADERIRPDTPGGKKDKKGGGFTRQASSFIDPTFNWDALQWMRSFTDLPIVVKGIQRAKDAVIAMRMGCDGIVLSNHGGRAADTAPPGILTLLELHKNCPEVFGKMEILVDGGFRRGSDIVKAICLGASAVGIGRPFMYSIKYGSEGIEHAVEIIKDEIETAMRLCGMTDLMRDAHPDFVNTGEIDHLVPNFHHPYARIIARRVSKL
ncbi:uncharacterized protein A1O9_01540 [Exophiala aquamarina CBS 119918]|uniref:L-lactate dehydrogenase (Cytochrome) n=1 Tax=Exophiala aquamarina CBS 119918 TaxID=1182545 RepID=A0A072PUX5_9EURO|nr:uncharacterized protein A1O9_01540 [Exophiala aquamarina CBS 119918]KEF63562.1 hypothetical protein A1O9_01540 [Exophiala aquamarina CBS 119918]